MNTRILSILIFTCACQLAVSCSNRQASRPLSLVWGNEQKQHDTLIVFLPGVRDNKQDFIDKGFFSRLQQSGISADMAAADLHLAYLENNTTVERLHEDIVVPAQNQGYKNIWLTGISLGGLNALLYMKNRASDVCGVILLSPYMGEKRIAAEIAQAGGINHWQPQNPHDMNAEEQLWLWLKETRLDNVYLGTGSKDRFYLLQQQLAQQLPERNTHIINGGHRWPVWRDLWKYFLTLMETEKVFLQCNSRAGTKHPL